MTHSVALKRHAVRTLARVTIKSFVGSVI